MTKIVTCQKHKLLQWLGLIDAGFDLWQNQPVRKRMLIAVFAAAIVAWVAVPLGYSAHGLIRAAEAKISSLGYYDARVIKYRMLGCSSPFSYGVVVIYRRERHDPEGQGRMCLLSSGWVWYPSTDDLAHGVPL